MNETRPHVFIVLVNTNGWKDTVECLESLYLLDYPSCTAVVVDNHSPDGSTEHLVRWAGGERSPFSRLSPSVPGTLNPVPRPKPIPVTLLADREVESGKAASADRASLVLIQARENVGFAGGNNLGIRFGRTADPDGYIWLLNNDTVCDPKALSALMDRITAQPDCGLCGSTVLFYRRPDTIQARGGIAYDPVSARGKPIGLGGKVSDPADSTAIESRMSYVFGASMLVAPRFIRETGLMSERYFLYFEELDWISRAPEPFKKMGYAPGSLVYHKVGGFSGSHPSPLQRSYLSDYYIFSQHDPVYKKFHPGIYPVTWLVLFAKALRRWARGQPDRARMMLRLLAGRDRFPVAHPVKTPVPRPALSVSMIEPVGGRGGMDYYDFGLCLGLVRAGVPATLFSCEQTGECPTGRFDVRAVFRGVYGPAPKVLRGLRYLLGLARALGHALASGSRIWHVHVFHAGPLETLSVWAAKILRRRVIVTAHDVVSFAPGGGSPAWARLVYRGAGRIVAHNEVSRGELVRALGCPPEKVRVIPHGNYLDALGPRPDPAEARRRLGLPVAAKVLLFFGHLKQVKGLDLLLEALPAALERFPEARVLAAGEAWKIDAEVYVRQAERLGIADCCALHFRHIGNEEVGSYFSAADLVVLPYRRIYQSGVLLMAMSCGKPVLASDLPGMREVIADGENGFLFPPENPAALAAVIVRVLSDPEGAARAGREGLRLMRERYAWEEIGERTARVYREA